METKPKTNANRIRAMTDEELAEKANCFLWFSTCTAGLVLGKL